MSKKQFTDIEREQLSENKYVIKVSNKAITYADEFKQLFIDQYMLGKTPREIFEDNGFDVNVLGIKRVETSAGRWKKAYGKDGLVGLTDSRKGTSGRPRKRELTTDEIIAKQEARIELLESQVELLKKLDSTERLLVNQGNKLCKSKLFKLIKDAVDQGLGRMTRYLCELLNVSRSGYYSYLKATGAREERARLDAKIGELIKKAFHRRGFQRVLAPSK